MMRKKTRLIRLSKQAGFSLLEACIAVLVTAIAISLSGDLLSMLTSFEKQKQPVNQLALSYLQLDRFLKKDCDKVYVDLKNSDEDKLTFVKTTSGKENKRYVLKTINHSSELILTTPNNGYMPLLKIDGASFQAQDGLVLVSITEPHKNYSKLYLKLDQAPKADEKKEKAKEKTAEDQKDEKKTDEGKNETSEKQVDSKDPPASTG